MSEEKSKKLSELKKKMAGDKSLPLQESNFVFGEGSAESDVMFVGEAPGPRKTSWAGRLWGARGSFWIN